MQHTHGYAWLAATFLAVGTAIAQPAEFNRLIHQRNDLYAQLASLAAEAEAPSSRRHAGELAGRTKHAQAQLDMIERRLADLAVEQGLEVPRPPVPSFRESAGQAAPTAVAMAPPGTLQPMSPKDRAEFNKLISERNAVHKKLSRLDEEASSRMMRGENPITVHADQVSLQDQLDLMELRLAIVGTRYGVPVPPPPGSEAGAGGQGASADDGANRNLDKAFARGRQRAMDKIRDDADRLLADLDFRAFLSDEN